VTIAYLDPGSGSLIASALVGGVAAAGVAVKQARHRLTSRFRKGGDEPSSAGTEGAGSGDVDAPTTTDA
jgi:hypothetical protein